MDVTINVTNPEIEPDVDDMEVCPICGDSMDNGQCNNCGYNASDNDADDHMEMSAKTRNALPDSDFLYVSGNTRMFPVNDEKHIVLAIQMLPKAKLSPEIKARIKAKLRRLAKQHGIDMSEDNSTKPNLLEDITTGKIELSEKQSDGFHRAQFLVTTVNSRNRNGRIYTKDALARELQHQPNGSVLGQDGHPTSNRKFTEQFLIWEKLMMENNNEYAIAKVVPTIPHGSNFILLAQAGAMASCSRVGTGSVKEGVVNGVKGQVVQPDYELKHIDIIVPNEQSDQNATMLHFEMYQGDENNTESVENKMPESEPIVETEKTPVVNETPVAETVPTSTETATPQATAKTETTQASATVTASTPQSVPVLPTEIIEKLSSEIQAKAAVIATQNVKLSELASQNATQEAQIRAMTESFTALNEEILRLGKNISELNSGVQERNQIISERDELLIKRNKTLAERQKLLVQAHATISERDAVIAERNVQVMQRNMLVSQRDTEIGKLHKELQERNEVLAKQDRVIQERDAAVAERDAIIAQERASLQERDAMIAQIDLSLVEKNTEIMALHNQLLAEKVNVDNEKKKNEAFQYLFEKVQIEGEKASWFIFNDLRNCPTKDEVDEKFAASKARGIALIEGVSAKAGKAVLKDVTPTDADEPLNPEQKANSKSEKKDQPKLESDAARKANSVARMSGL